MAGASERPLVPWTDNERQIPPHMQLYDETPSSPVYDPPAGAGSSAIPDDDEDDGDNMFRDMTFAEILEDLNSRFLINLPAEEYTLVRLYWQAEQAHWFYEDYLRPLNPQLPALSQRQFTQLIIASSPLYSDWEIDYDAVWAEYCAYKKMVPCCGGILLNQDGDKVLMVRGWKANAGWCFPRGKINSEESEAACAIREVEEETGFDMSDFIDPNAFIKTQVSAQEITMFLVLGVDESTVFKTQTRKEIGAIEWVPLVDLPVWSNRKGPKRTGGKKEKKFYNVTPFVGGIKKFLAKNGINPHQPRRKERGGGRQQQQQRQGGPGGRDLQPFEFDAAPSPAGRELKPFAFGDESPQSKGTPSTAIDHLFAKFIEKKDENAVAVESSTARTMDQLFAPEQDGGDKNDDDLLAKLLGNVGIVSDAAPPTLPPPDDKQSKLLSVLQPPSAPAPPPSTHQHNLLSMLASPKLDDEERASRQRALLESTLLGPGPTGSPANGGPSPAPPSNIMSPMTPLPQSQAPGAHQQGLHAPPQGPQGQQWSPAPPQPGPPPGWAYPTQAPRRGPPSQVTPQAPLPASQAALQHSPMPQTPGHGYAPLTPPSQPRSDHQRNLLGTLFNKPGGGFPPVSPGYHGPSGGAGGPHAARGPAPPFPNYQPMPMPHVNMGHQRQLSGGLPGQPGAGRPIGGAPGLPGQPGQTMGMGWGIPPPGMFGAFPSNPNGPGPGPNPFPPQSQQGGFHEFGQPQAPQQFQSHQPQQHAQQPPPPQLQQQQGQGQQHQQQPPARSAQTPPAMHQPVARPPVSGSLLGLAAGR